MQEKLENNIFLCFLFSDPPGRPNITGISSESVLIEDQVRRITCISMAGNPLGKILKLVKLHRKRWLSLESFLFLSHLLNQMHYPSTFQIRSKDLIDSNLVHFFEDETKMKILIVI